MSAPGPGGRILVVDDVEMNRDMLSRRLTRRGHSVTGAVNGRDALERAREGEFDLILLDITMPVMDGYETLGALKADAALAHIPVVMISAVDETESVARCIELGAEDYLPKPFNASILKARVDACLEKKRLRDRERLYAKSLERELEIGREIQAGFLPESLPRPAGWQIAAHFAPARQCAGDFYDAFDLAAGRVALVAADVCDKGVGAALFMALFRSLIRAIAAHPAGEAESAPDLLRRTARTINDYIALTHSRANMFATVFLAILDPASGRIDYVNGGQEAALIGNSAGVRIRLGPTGPAWGMMPDAAFSTGSEEIRSGETLLAFTDGVTEARGEAGFFGEERLSGLLAASSSADGLVEAVRAALSAHVGGAEPHDDIALIVARRD